MDTFIVPFCYLFGRVWRPCGAVGQVLEKTIEKTMDGFLAHEVQEIVPEAVVGEKDAINEDGSIKAQSMDAAKLVPLLTAALQEAVAKIEALETRITTLEG